MKEISLNILDIACNSVKAKADTIKILLDETEDTLSVTISDNGCGMTKDFLRSVTDPFTTTRTTRKVGLGIPLFQLSAQQTGGSFSIDSRSQSEFTDEHGTDVVAVFNKKSIDFTPLGDIISTVVTLIQGGPDIRWVFIHKSEDREISLDTAELKEILGDVPLDNYEVIQWITEYLRERYA